MMPSKVQALNHYFARTGQISGRWKLKEGFRLSNSSTRGSCQGKLTSGQLLSHIQQWWCIHLFPYAGDLQHSLPRRGSEKAVSPNDLESSNRLGVNNYGGCSYQRVTLPSVRSTEEMNLIFGLQ